MKQETTNRYIDELDEIADSLEILARADRLSFRDVLENAEHVFSIRHTVTSDVLQNAVQKLAIVVCRSVFRKIDDVSGDPVTHQIFIDMLKDIDRENALRTARLTAYDFHYSKGKYVQDIADEQMKRIIDSFDPDSMSDGYSVYQSVVVKIYDILNKSGQAVPLEWNMPVRKESAQKIIIEWSDVPELNKIEYSPIIRELFRTARQAVTESKTVRQSNPHYVYVLDDDASCPEYEIYRRFKSCALIGGQNALTVNDHSNLTDIQAMTDFLTALNLTDIQKERLMMKASGMTFRDMCLKDGRYTVSHPTGKTDPKTGKPVMFKIHGSKIQESGYIIQPTDKITYSTRCYQDSLNQIQKKVNDYVSSLDDFGIRGGKADMYSKAMNKLMNIESESVYDDLALMDADENLTALTDRKHIRTHLENVRQTARQTDSLTARNDAGYMNTWKAFDGSMTDSLTARQDSPSEWSKRFVDNDWKIATYQAHVQPRKTVTVYNSKQTARQAVNERKHTH